VSIVRSNLSKRIYSEIVKRATTVSPTLEAAVKIVGPVAIPNRRKQTLVYFLSRAVVGQQLSTVAARTIWDRVETAAKESKQEVPDFFLDRNSDTIRACGVSANKTKALLEIHRSYKSGQLRERELRRMNNDIRTQVLMEIWGVGPWTCDMASIFFFRCPDIWPVGDGAVQKAFKSLIGRRKPEIAAARFSPYRSYLALMMWRWVDTSPEQ